MFQIFILHDDIREQDWLLETIHQLLPNARLRLFDKGREALAALIQSNPRLIFLNASLEDMSAFQFLEKVPAKERSKVVFLGEDDSQAVNAFDFNVLDYLRKPFTKDRVKKSLHRLENLNDTIENGISPGHQAVLDAVLPIKVSGNIFFVEKETIRYIVASGYYIEIFSEDKKYLVREPLHLVLERLALPQFIRIHRSSILNTDYLDKINLAGQGETEAVMKDGKVLKISKTYKEELLGRIRL
jgi:two-component system LytT family response regulator